MIPFCLFFKFCLPKTKINLEQPRAKEKPNLNYQNILVGLFVNFVNVHPGPWKNFCTNDKKTISDTDCFEISSLAEAMVAVQKIQRWIRDLD